MKLLAIAVAIFMALCAGIGIGDTNDDDFDRRHPRLIGALVLLFFSILCGVLAWRL